MSIISIPQFHRLESPGNQAQFLQRTVMRKSTLTRMVETSLCKSITDQVSHPDLVVWAISITKSSKPLISMPRLMLRRELPKRETRKTRAIAKVPIEVIRRTQRPEKCSICQNLRKVCSQSKEMKIFSNMPRSSKQQSRKTRKLLNVQKRLLGSS